MRLAIGLRITGDVTSAQGPAFLRRILGEVVSAIDRGEFAKDIPDRMTVGDVTVELGAGPASQPGEGDPVAAPQPSPAPEPAQGHVEVAINE